MKKNYVSPEVQYTLLSSADVIQSSAIIMEEIQFGNN